MSRDTFCVNTSVHHERPGACIKMYPDPLGQSYEPLLKLAVSKSVFSFGAVPVKKLY